MRYNLILFFLLLLFSFGCSGINATPEESSPTISTTDESQKPLSAPVRASNYETFGDLLVIGEAEFVYIGEETIRLAARIDTGATTSSLSAKEIKVFERDGNKWVRFQVVEPKSGKQTEFKRPLIRTAEIKRHGAEKQKRYVVKLPIRLGQIDQEIEFTLTDRSQFEFPVLIGRNFLKGTAIVDVNRKYSITPLTEKK